MHGKGFYYPVGKRYPVGRHLGGKDLLCLFLDDGTPFGVSLLLERPLRMRLS